MPYLITGSAGFIGFHLARRLLSAGERVVGVDGYVEAFLPELNRRRHKVLAAEQPGFTAIEGDLRDPAVAEHAVAQAASSGAGADEGAGEEPLRIVHLAGQAALRRATTIAATVEANVVTFHNILDAARRHGAERVVFASSTSVYGNGDDSVRPDAERAQRVAPGDDRPGGDDGVEQPRSHRSKADRPLSVYAATKRANELIAHAIAHAYGLPCLGLRIGTCYGSWGKPDMALWLFAERIERGEPLSVYGNGTVQRAYVDVDDVVDAMVAALTLESPPAYALVNVAGARAEPVAALVSALEVALGREAIVKNAALPVHEVATECLDLAATSELLGVTPRHDLAAIVGRFVEWYRAHPDLTAAAAAARAAAAD